MAKEHIRHWQIGDVRITRIVEVNAHEDPFTMLSAGTEPDLGKHYPWLAPNFVTPDGQMKISFQAFALRTPSKTIIVDTCIGEGRVREYDIFTNMQSDYLDDLVAAGYDPGAADIVLCTHLHFDHVGWNTRADNGHWVPTFPHARYLFDRREYEHWRAARAEDPSHFDHWIDAIDPVVEAGLVDLIGPQHQICPEVSLFPTPGHTPGHVSVLIRSRGEEAVITGDLMHHPIQLARPDLPMNADSDKTQGIATRTAFCERFADREVTVIGSHFCEPTAGRIVSDTRNWRLTWESVE
jgi:glyoxylase-like metal-dependent hydrolase (beta-lactamase superfamily II)